MRPPWQLDIAMGFVAYRQCRWTDEERKMKLGRFRGAVMASVTVILLGGVTVMNASAATPNRGKRVPEKPPALSGPLMGKASVDDVLRIQVDGEPALSGRYRVDPAGGIDYPFVGRITVSGMKAAAVADLIADGLKKSYARHATVRVSVETEAAQKGAK
jgi:hypothetical protein